MRRNGIAAFIDSLPIARTNPISRLQVKDIVLKVDNFYDR